MAAAAEPAEQFPSAPTRESFAALMSRLVGDVAPQDVATLLPAGKDSARTHVSYQAVEELMRGWHLKREHRGGPVRPHIPNPTLSRLEQIGDALGVTFELIARDASTGRPLTDMAPDEVAPGLRRFSPALRRAGKSAP